MSASTALITDMTSVITNGPSATTLAKSEAAAGPIMDYVANTKLCLLKLQEAEIVMARIKTDTDSSDSTNLTLINGILVLLNGTSSPSTAGITDTKTLYNNGPNSASQAKAIAAAGPIIDYPGSVILVRRKLEEVETLLTNYVLVNTDSGTDGTNRTLISNILLALV